MGPAYIPSRTYGNFQYGPVYRRGTFITRAVFLGEGVALGRNLVTNEFKKNPVDSDVEYDANQYNHF